MEEGTEVDKISRELKRAQTKEKAARDQVSELEEELEELRASKGKSPSRSPSRANAQIAENTRKINDLKDDLQNEQRERKDVYKKLVKVTPSCASFEPQP